MKSKMQCKDVPTDPILEYVWSVNNGDVSDNPDLELRKSWALCYGVSENAFPPDTPDKLYWAKMRQLGRSGLLRGCFCGCKGDYVVTEKGCARIGRPWHGVDW